MFPSIFELVHSYLTSFQMNMKSFDTFSSVNILFHIGILCILGHVNWKYLCSSHNGRIELPISRVKLSLQSFIIYQAGYFNSYRSRSIVL